MSDLHLYPVVRVIGQDYSKVKVSVQPQQCMSLHDIIRRFIRKEALPIEKQGVYQERMGDLEKISRMDITVQVEQAKALKAGIAKSQKAVKDAEALKLAQDMAKSAPAASGRAEGS